MTTPILDLLTLTTRLISLEATVGGQSTKNTQQDNRLTALETSQGQQDTKIAAVETKNSQQDGRLTALETAQSQAATRMGTIESTATTDRTNTASRFTGVENANTTQTQQISALDARASSLEATPPMAPPSGSNVSADIWAQLMLLSKRVTDLEYPMRLRYVPGTKGRWTQ